MDNLLLKVDEAGVALRIGRSKVYALLAAGELPAVRIGRELRIPVAALQEWIARQTRPAFDNLPPGLGARALGYDVADLDAWLGECRSSKTGEPDPETAA